MIAFHQARKSEQGFSMVELLVVITMMVILTTVTIISFRGNKRNYAADDEATKILSFFREAYQRALSQRQAQKVSIDRANNIVRLTDMGRLPGGDEFLINRGVLNTLVTLDRPTVGGSPLTLPPAPYAYGAASFNTSGVLDLYFLADGTVTNQTGWDNQTYAPVSTTFFFSPSAAAALNSTQASQPAGNLIRAVTLYGPTGSAKFWRFDSDKFIWEIN
jgi:prepilin-type N-terminal cleavage/methylation domain-containing protein